MQDRIERPGAGIASHLPNPANFAQIDDIAHDMGHGAIDSHRAGFIVL